jgi:hypothetical protein
MAMAVALHNIPEGLIVAGAPHIAALLHMLRLG